jgi:hypothetical protein
VKRKIKKQFWCNENEDNTLKDKAVSTIYESVMTARKKFLKNFE